jgi:hypothetical protein
LKRCRRKQKRRNKKRKIIYEEDEVEDEGDFEDGREGREMYDNWQSLSQIVHLRARKSQRQYAFAERLAIHFNIQTPIYIYIYIYILLITF